MLPKLCHQILQEYHPLPKKHGPTWMSTNFRLFWPWLMIGYAQKTARPSSYWSQDGPLATHFSHLVWPGIFSRRFRSTCISTTTANFRKTQGQACIKSDRFTNCLLNAGAQCITWVKQFHWWGDDELEGTFSFKSLSKDTSPPSTASGSVFWLRIKISIVRASTYITVFLKPWENCEWATHSRVYVNATVALLYLGQLLQ